MKRVWITGASSGIGEALAYAFAREGASLIISARNEKELERVKSNCVGAQEVMVQPLDIGDFDAVFGAAEKILKQYGKIDILVNNAGISQRGLAKDTIFEVDKQLLNVNFLGTVALTKAILPSMIQHQLGHIVVITSVVGKFGSPVRTSYSASKHALHGFFDSLRAEIWRDNIKVTLVCPGYVRTNVSMNALTATGAKQGTMDETTGSGLSPDDVSTRILKAIRDEKEEIYIGGLREVAAVYIKRFFPRLFSRIVRNAKVT